MFIKPEKLEFNELTTISSYDFLLDSESGKSAIIRSNPLNFSLNIEMKDSLSTKTSNLFTLADSEYIHANYRNGKLFLLSVSGDKLLLKYNNGLRTLVLDTNIYYGRNNNLFAKLLNLDKNRILVFFNKIIYIVKNNKILETQENISDVVVLSDKYYFLKNQTSSLKFIENENSEINEYILAPVQNPSMFVKNNIIFIVSGSGDNFFIKKFNTETKIFSDETLKIKNKNLFDYSENIDNNNLNLVFYRNNKIMKSTQNLINEEDIPDNVGKIIGLKCLSNNIVIYGDNKLFVYDSELNYLGKYEIQNIQNINEISEGKILVKTKNGSKIITFKYNKYWLIKYIVTNYYYAFIYLFLIIAFLFAYNRLRQKNIMLRTLLDLPSSGMVLTFNQNGRLVSINNLGRKYLKMTDSIPLGQFFENYLRVEEYGELRELVRKSIKLKDNFNQKISLLYDNNVIELFCTISSIINKAGFYKGFIITAIDITEELERKRMSNWAQLAHDMQTNLSTIRLNAEQLSLETDPKNNSRRKKIIHQTNLLIQRVRDIVTVGRTSKLTKLSYLSRDIIDELISEFDLSFNKNVVIGSDVENFSLKCDKVKLISAMRNAVENAIKAINGNHGNIIVKARRDNRFVYFTISDDGPGMDSWVKNNMINPFFTTGNAETGTEAKEGTGIGSIIMQNVAQQHGGELLIKSAKDEGTEIIFKLPYLRN
jgi:signal transduction histidine kinase